MEIFKANKQWAIRPPDERFSSIEALYNSTKQYADVAREKDVPWNNLRVEAIDGDVQLLGKLGIPTKLTHWAFGQLATKVNAPAAYLRDLPATLAAQNLNHGLAQRVKDVAGSAVASLLFHTNGGMLLRSVTTDRYARIWNYEVAARLLQLKGWEPATPDTSFAPSVRVDMGEGALGVTALYASDHDMFAFLRNKGATIAEAGSDQPLYRGIIAENSEVGASALKLTRFLYRYMCGNHIIWDASKVVKISLRHVGSVREKFELYTAQMKRYAEESASDEEVRIATARSTLIAGSKDEVLDALFGIRSLGISRKALEASYEAVVPDQDGDPNTVWGMVQGVTRHSQTIPYADERTKLDKAAGKILDAVRF